MYEQTASRLNDTLEDLERQNELNMEPLDTLDEKQARIHKQKTLCFNVDELDVG